MTTTAQAQTTPGPYATCQDCGIDLADRDAMNAHTDATLVPTGASAGLTASSHRVLVVNPTEAEQRAARVRARVRACVTDALNDLCDDLRGRVEHGEFTAQDVTDNLWMFDLPDAWEEHLADEDA